MRKILALDGGGVRGVIPATVLAWFEKQTGKPSYQTWDLIAGTSTGGILAAGLAHTLDGKTPTYSAEDLVGLYRDHSATIFHRPWYRELALLKVKYPATGIEDVLRKYYGDAMLSSALTNVLITAFDQKLWLPRMFKSYKAKGDPLQDAPLWYAARATSAAPTYFPSLDGLVDGGVLGATNPSMIAVTEARKLWPGEELFLLSIGTGKKDASIDTAKSQDWGELAYLSSLIDMLLDAPERTVEAMIEETLLPASRLRIQGTLAGSIPSHAMDDASTGNIQALTIFAGKMITDGLSALESAVTLCKAN